MQRQFFKNENKFVVGRCYETLEVNTGNIVGVSDDLSDEYGDIRPGSVIYAGRYINSEVVGIADNMTRIDRFTNDSGKVNVIPLNFEGSTRYREVDCETRQPLVSNIPLPMIPVQSQYASLSAVADIQRQPAPSKHIGMPQVVKDADHDALSNKINRMHKRMESRMHKQMESRMHKQMEIVTRYIDRVLCKVCFENEINCVLTPCGHTLCNICRAKLIHLECPLCKTAIDSMHEIKLGSLDSSYKQKYLKYKNKYLRMKQQLVLKNENP